MDFWSAIGRASITAAIVGIGALILNAAGGIVGIDPQPLVSIFHDIGVMFVGMVAVLRMWA